MEMKSIERQVKFLFIFCILVQFLDFLYFFIFGEGLIIEKIIYSIPLTLFLAFPSYLLYSLVKGNKYILVKFNLIFEGLPIYYIFIGVKCILCWPLALAEHDVSLFNIIDFTNPIVIGILIFLLIIIIISMIYSRNILKTYVQKLKSDNSGLIGESDEAVLLKMI